MFILHMVKFVLVSKWNGSEKLIFKEKIKFLSEEEEEWIDFLSSTMTSLCQDWSVNQVYTKPIQFVPGLVCQPMFILYMVQFVPGTGASAYVRNPTQIVPGLVPQPIHAYTTPNFCPDWSCQPIFILQANKFVPGLVDHRVMQRCLDYGFLVPLQFHGPNTGLNLTITLKL